jgi:hypothetical protein
LARKVREELTGPGGKGQKGEKAAEKVYALRLHKTYSRITGNFRKNLSLREINLPVLIMFFK